MDVDSGRGHQQAWPLGPDSKAGVGSMHGPRAWTADVDGRFGHQQAWTAASVDTVVEFLATAWTSGIDRVIIAGHWPAGVHIR